MRAILSVCLSLALKGQLFPGASVGNPIDILATGTPDHLRICIDYCEEKLENVDAIMAIFGTPGLVTMFEMYDVLHEKMQTCCKPIFPVLPSINTAGAEVAAFLAKGHVNFSDEVTLGTALSRIVNAPRPAVPEIELFGVDVPRIRRIIDSIPENGYIEPHYVQALLHAAGIPLVDEFVSNKKEEVVDFARRCGKELCFQFFRQFAFQFRYIQASLTQSIRQHHSRTSGMCDNGKVLSFQFGKGEYTAHGSQFFTRETTHNPSLTKQCFYSRIGTGNRPGMRRSSTASAF